MIRVVSMVKDFIRGVRFAAAGQRVFVLLLVASMFSLPIAMAVTMLWSNSVSVVVHPSLVLTSNCTEAYGGDAVNLMADLTVQSLTDRAVNFYLNGTSIANVTSVAGVAVLDYIVPAPLEDTVYNFTCSCEP